LHLHVFYRSPFKFGAPTPRKWRLSDNFENSDLNPYFPPPSGSGQREVIVIDEEIPLLDGSREYYPLLSPKRIANDHFGALPLNNHGTIYHPSQLFLSPFTSLAEAPPSYILNAEPDLQNATLLRSTPPLPNNAPHSGNEHLYYRAVMETTLDYRLVTRLYVGNKAAACDQSFLDAYGICSRFGVCGPSTTVVQIQTHHKTLPFANDAASLEPFLDFSSHMIHHALGLGSNVLIYCETGYRHSVCFAAAYLIVYCRMTWAMAESWLKSRSIEFVLAPFEVAALLNLQMHIASKNLLNQQVQHAYTDSKMDITTRLELADVAHTCFSTTSSPSSTIANNNMVDLPFDPDSELFLSFHRKVMAMNGQASIKPPISRPCQASYDSDMVQSDENGQPNQFQSLKSTSFAEQSNKAMKTRSGQVLIKQARPIKSKPPQTVLIGLDEGSDMMMMDDDDDDDGGEFNLIRRRKTSASTPRVRKSLKRAVTTVGPIKDQWIIKSNQDEEVVKLDTVEIGAVEGSSLDAPSTVVWQEPSPQMSTNRISSILSPH
jgi:protein-tyrosine phosphatase